MMTGRPAPVLKMQEEMKQHEQASTIPRPFSAHIMDGQDGSTVTRHSKDMYRGLVRDNYSSIILMLLATLLISCTSQLQCY